jgi:hypothetical protein
MELLVGVDAFAARPEDVILAKLQYYKEGGSEKHMRDIASMFKVSGDEIDRDYIVRWAEQLGVTEQWQAVVRKLSG